MARTLSKRPGTDLSRLRRHAQNHLGVIMTDDMNQVKEFRNNFLDLLDRYYESSQYEDLQDWEEAIQQEEYVPIRKRKPRVIYNLAKVLVDKVAAKLVGESAFPKFIVEDDDDDTAFFRIVQKACRFRRSLITPIKHLLISGAVFVRYYIINGVVKIEYAKSKYCYPVFNASGELESISIKYVYEDQNDRNTNGTPIQKWYKIELTKTADILYDNPVYRAGVRPSFNEVNRAEHGLGWVQGEWFVTHEDKFDYDGYSLFGDILGFIDELNYSLSQSSQAASYNQEPQLIVNNVDEDELERLVKSSQKAWNLGRQGEAKYLETDLGAVEAVSNLRDKMRSCALDVVRIVLHDPEKMVASAQSGTALGILNAPLVELIDELRTIIEPNTVQLLVKIGMTCLHYNAMGEETVVITPPGYVPASIDITTQWPAIFPLTLEDMNKMAQVAQSLSSGKIVSRESLTRWIASNTPIIDNAEEELSKIAAEPDLNPFGTFGGQQ